MNIVIKWMLLLTVGSVVQGVFADGDSIFHVGSDEYRTSAMTNAACWRVGSENGSVLGEVGDALPTDRDYYCLTGAIRTPLSSIEFPIRSLTIGGNSTSATLDLCMGDAKAELATEKLILKGGDIFNLDGSRSPTIKADVEVVSRSVPFKIVDVHRAEQIIFDGNVTGDENAWLWIYARDTINRADWKNTNSTIHFKNDALAGYKGKIELHQLHYSNRSTGTLSITNYAELRSGTVITDARIIAHKFCHIGPKSAGDVFKLKSLELEDNTCIKAALDCKNKSASLMQVMDSLTLSTELPIRVRVETVDADYPSEYLKLAIFKAPNGINLTKAMFILDQVRPIDPFLDIEVETDAEDGLSTVYVCAFPKVTQTISDEYATEKDALNSYTCVSGAHWSVNEVPDRFHVYFSEKSMRNTSANGSISEFPGHTLVKSSNLCLFGDFTVDNFIVYKTGCSVAAYQTMTKLRGHILHTSSIVGSNYNLNLTCQNNRTVEVYSNIEGDSAITITSSQADKTGTVRLAGDNSKFTGRISLHNSGSNKTDGMGPNLQFDSAEALGGPLDTMQYNYHDVRDYAKLYPLNTMTLNRINCGFYVSGPCYLDCAANVEFTLLEHVTWNGEITKTGAGVFALGGGTPNFNNENGTVPTQDHNRIKVTEGSLKVVDSECFQGTEVVMSSGTKLIVPVSTNSTQGVGKYGLHNVRWNKALVLPEEGITVEIVDPNGDTKPSKEVARPLTAAICTVNAEAANAIRGKLHIAGSPYTSCVVSTTPQEITNADGSVTFYVRLNRGMRILFR